MKKIYILLAVFTLHFGAMAGDGGGLYNKKITPPEPIKEEVIGVFEPPALRAGGGDEIFVKEEMSPIRDSILFWILSGASYGLYIGHRTRKRSKLRIC
jgi:hypothetical protein